MNSRTRISKEGIDLVIIWATVAQGVGTELFHLAELCDVITVAATSIPPSRTTSSTILYRLPTQPNLSCMTKNQASPIFTADPLMVSLFWPFDLWRSEKPFVAPKSRKKRLQKTDYPWSYRVSQQVLDISLKKALMASNDLKGPQIISKDLTDLKMG